jgi:hypothetical protein
MGNFVNGCVILIMMAWFGMTGPSLDATKARDVISIQFAVGAAVSVFMVLWRWFKLKESEVWEAEKHDFDEINENELHHSKRYLTLNAFANFWWVAQQSLALLLCIKTFAVDCADSVQPSVPRCPTTAGTCIPTGPPHVCCSITWLLLRRPRLTATSMAWVANDFAFYGNKLFQSTFIALLYPKATEFERMQRTVLNSAVSLMGYFCAAALIDKKW